MQHSVFGFMPFDTIFWFIKSLACLRFICSNKLLLFSASFSIPGVSVSKINFSALIAAAISPATKSALILCEMPSIVAPILEMTGI